MAKAAARHILVSTKEECENIKKQIEDGTDFAEMAKQHSQCPSGKQGGDLGVKVSQCTEMDREVVFWLVQRKRRFQKCQKRSTFRKDPRD